MRLEYNAKKIKEFYMYMISVEKECGCFKRSDLQNNVAMDNKDEAMMRSIDMVNHMNGEFCGKHKFKLIETDNSFVIAMNDSTSNGCCGGGCSSHAH